MSDFVDEAQIHLKAGNGGAGSVSFRREAHVEKGGPDGGDGGHGGDVWLEADRNVASLLTFRDVPHREATNGKHGAGKKRHGAQGEDHIVHVPEGTIVRDRSGEILVDMGRHGTRWLGAKGGQGGRGNARFLTNKRRAPSFAEQGEVGEEYYYNLELRLFADAAIVGFPNVGKSTLISVISRAKPKIANYPFTTLVPNLGVVDRGGREFVVADIPGLIEGASEGKGLGHRFLRHISRARVLLLLLDLAGEVSPEEQEAILLRELGAFEPSLLDRPRLVYGSRADLARHDWSGPSVCAPTHEGVDGLVHALGKMVEQARAEIEIGEGYVLHRLEPTGVRVDRDDAGRLVVSGRAAERAVALNDLTTPEALAYVIERLKNLGVQRLLRRAGAREGDTVLIGGFEFAYDPD